MITAKTYIVGIYVRLSKDDERAGESVSIENQKLLLTKYVEEQGWELKEIFTDDGYSGTNFNRPAFQRMLQDAKDKRINLILVKDLSRLGRNYIEVGKLTDETLPELGCRFIALNDSVDTFAGDNDMMVYRNLFNEFYSRDTSKKVRTVKKACAESGKYLGTYAPYGYKKSPDNKHKLIVDEELAPVIKRIFTLRCQGKGYRSIASILNEDRVPSPKEVYYQRKGGENTSSNGLWNEVTLQKIIRNEVYIGHMVQGKTGTVSYKTHKIVGKPEEEWIRVENTHQPIIDSETWNTVCAIDEKKYKPRKTTGNGTNMFVGLLKCADCGSSMRFHAEKGTHKDGSPFSYNSFMCGNYARSGKHACTVHTIYESALTELVLHDIRAKAQLVACDEQSVIDQILRTKNKESIAYLATYKRELKASEARLVELENIVRSLYEDRVKGNIPDAMFKSLMPKYEQERIDKTESIKILREKVTSSERQWDDVSVWAGIIQKYIALETLESKILLELIDKIEVFEARRVDGKRICDVRIYYRFVGDISQAVQDVEARYGKAI